MKKSYLLTENQALLAELINGVPHGIALLDTDLCIVMMNRFLEAMSGYRTEQVRGVYGEFVLRSNLGSKNQTCVDVLQSGDPLLVEGNIINRRRKKIPIQFTLTRLDDAGGEPIGLLLVLEDISLARVNCPGQLDASISSSILGHSPQMERVFDLMAVLARTDASVLITGETGTGKDMMAEALHEQSLRSRQPFVKVNCGALPEALLESELFGHVKGAFTGAVSDSVGMFRLADKGTIFLTEIGDLSMPLQVKLLSVLDDQEFFPVGGSKKVKVDVRIIAATHRSLRREVQLGRFREDLFYRLNVLHLHMPPLREREGDVRLLMDHFLSDFSAKLGKAINGCSKKALQSLVSYRYPGNVRELRNIVEYAVNICRKDKIGVKDLPEYLFKPVPSLPQAYQEEKPPAASPAVEREPASQKTIGGWTEVEREMIMDALRETGGNRTKAAAKLGWGRTTLWRKLHKYQLI